MSKTHINFVINFNSIFEKIMVIIENKKTNFTS